MQVPQAREMGDAADDFDTEGSDYIWCNWKVPYGTRANDVWITIA